MSLDWFREEKVRVLVFGDIFLDKYTYGAVDRISPEAPIPVLKSERVEWRPGGAANVVKNLVSLGADVRLSSMIGTDFYGDQLLHLLNHSAISLDGVFRSDKKTTGVKERFISGSQQLLRVDLEDTSPVEEEAQLKQYFNEVMDMVDVVVVSDYAKGVCTSTLLNCLLTLAREKGKISVIDPKSHDFSKYSPATIIKPNRKEAYIAASLPQTSPIKDVAKKIHGQGNFDWVWITLSKGGMRYFDAHLEEHLEKAQAREIVDVTGAGDTCLAIIALGMGMRRPLAEIAKMASLGSGICIEHIGCYAVSLQEIFKKNFTLDPKQKIFDQEKMDELFHTVFPKSQFLFLHMDSLLLRPFELIHYIKKMKKEAFSKQLVAFFSEKEENTDVIEFVAQTREIDLVIIGNQGLERAKQFVAKQRYQVVEDIVVYA